MKQSQQLSINMKVRYVKTAIQSVIRILWSRLMKLKSWFLFRLKCLFIERHYGFNRRLPISLRYLE